MQQPGTEQSRAWRKETGKEEEGSKRTQNALSFYATSHVTWNDKEEAEKGRKLHQSARAMGKSGGLQRLLLPALPPEV